MDAIWYCSVRYYGQIIRIPKLDKAIWDDSSHSTCEKGAVDGHHDLKFNGFRWYHHVPSKIPILDSRHEDHEDQNSNSDTRIVMKV